MSDNSKIEWTDATWNPVRGCTKVSPGCAHCYAETFAERWRGIKGHPFEFGFDLRLVPEKLAEPLKWKTPRRIFVNLRRNRRHALHRRHADQAGNIPDLCPGLAAGVHLASQSSLETHSLDTACLVLLDQYGFKQVDTEVFTKPTACPTIDILFFISTQHLHRFADHPAVRKYIQLERVEDYFLAHREILKRHDARPCGASAREAQKGSRDRVRVQVTQQGKLEGVAGVQNPRLIPDGAHHYHPQAAAAFGICVQRHLDEISALPMDEMLARRYAKFRAFGEWQSV